MSTLEVHYSHFAAISDSHNNVSSLPPKKKQLGLLQVVASPTMNPGKQGLQV